MTQKEKIIIRFLSMPSDFHFDELEKLLGYFGFHEVKLQKHRVRGSGLLIPKACH